MAYQAVVDLAFPGGRTRSLRGSSTQRSGPVLAPHLKTSSPAFMSRRRREDRGLSWEAANIWERAVSRARTSPSRPSSEAACCPPWRCGGMPKMSAQSSLRFWSVRLLKPDRRQGVAQLVHVLLHVGHLVVHVRFEAQSLVRRPLGRTKEAAAPGLSARTWSCELRTLS